MRGFAPQPRLIWAVGIGAVLIALAVVSPLLVLVAVVYHVGLAALVARDLALLPGARGFVVRRAMPRPACCRGRARSRARSTGTAASPSPTTPRLRAAARITSGRSICRSGGVTAGGAG